MYGYVKSYDKKKKYGFVRADALLKDIFIHHRGIKCDENLIFPNQLVSFNLEETSRGLNGEEIVIPSGTIFSGEILGSNRKGYGKIWKTAIHTTGLNFTEFQEYEYEQFSFLTDNVNGL